MNDIENRWLAERTRRHFFRDCGVGLGSIAINSMMGQLQAGQLPVIDPANPDGLPQASPSSEGQERHLPPHGRRAEPTRTLRRQT
jgi:hypothetical protein